MDKIAKFSFMNEDYGSALMHIDNAIDTGGEEKYLPLKEVIEGFYRSARR